MLIHLVLVLERREAGSRVSFQELGVFWMGKKSIDVVGWDEGYGGYGFCMQNEINTREKSLGALGYGCEAMVRCLNLYTYM